MIKQLLRTDGPLVRRGAHRERADLAKERREAVFVAGSRHREEPVERVVFVRDEAIKACRSVVLRQRHEANDLASGKPGATTAHSPKAE
jgi:hypothetical protein